jgi:hypothetical protein
MKEFILFQTSKFKFSFAWYDLWIGAFIDTYKNKLYICLIPTLLLTINYGKN